MAKTYKVSTVEVSAQSRKEWLARKRGKGEVATSAAAVVVQSEASSAPSALDALFRQVNIGTDDAPKYVAEALFPLRIGDALLDWHADQKYLGVEHATESEKANFFATGGVTAGGIGSSSGGSGGGGSTTLAGLNDVSLKNAADNDMLVYNGTHWVNTPMSAIKPDLTAYATKTWVEDKGYALNTALLAVDTRLANVETIFEADSDGAINKWSEVVAFLDGIEGDTLDSILAQFATMQWVEGKKYITADALAPYALETSIPTKNSELENDAEYITAAALNGYATQNWVEGKKYLDGIDSTMVIDALGYTPYNAANFTKANIKSTLGISDWALAASKPSYKWSEINERPVKLSQFTDDVVSGNYLPIDGTAKNAGKLGNQAPTYYATASALSTLSTAVTEFRTLFDSLFEKDTANNAIKAKLSLYSVEGITAGGIGSGSSSGGGGASYNRLDAWADYTNDKSGWVLSALLGKDLDTRVNALANAGYITASALDPYAKSTDVANTYATQTALQGVDIRVQAIEYIFEEDQDGVINKWSEIVNFLAGVEGTTLDGILEQFATKDQLDTEIGKKANKATSFEGYGITGGTLTSQVVHYNAPFYIQRDSQPRLSFSIKNGANANFVYFGEDENKIPKFEFTNWGWTKGYEVLHAGNIANYTVPKTGGTFNGRLYVQASGSNGFANEMNGKGTYYIHVPNVASTSSWARGLSLYDDATSTTRELIASFGDYEGNKYDYLGGTYDNHILQLRLSDKFATFFGGLKVIGSALFRNAMTLQGDGFDVMMKTKNSSYELGFGCGSGGINRGIYDFTNDSWLIYRDAKLNTYIPQGNVGIGTTNPTEKLEVSGNVKATAFIGKLQGNADSATKLQTPRSLWGQSFDGTGNVSGDFSINRGSETYASFKIEASTEDRGFSLKALGGGSYVAIHTNDGGGVKEIMRVSHTNVGIGTTDPTAKLHVNGDMRLGDAILSWDSTNKCVTIKNANTGEKASLFVDGGVTGTVIN